MISGRCWHWARSSDGKARPLLLDEPSRDLASLILRGPSKREKHCADAGSPSFWWNRTCAALQLRDYGYVRQVGEVVATEPSTELRHLILALDGRLNEVPCSI